MSTYSAWEFTLHDSWLRIHVEHGVWVDHQIHFEHRYYFQDLWLDNSTSHVLIWRFLI